jgi:hypothetical protein
VAKHTAVVFEGQLSHPEAAFDKIDRALKGGFEVQIMAVHVPPAVALERTHLRFSSPCDGRGAPIAYMADVQGNLAQGLGRLQQRFGDSVQVAVFDNTPTQERLIKGWQSTVAHLEKAGHYDEIHQRLHIALDAGYREGRYSTEFYRQAAGRSRGAELDGSRGARDV